MSEMVTMAEAITEALGGRARRIREGWGRWSFDPAQLRLILTLENGYAPTYLDLATCTDAAHVLDFVMQTSNKRYATAEDLRDLLEAIDDLLHPQAVMCSWRGSRIIDPALTLADAVRIASAA